jgi:hypothetical protein
MLSFIWSFSGIYNFCERIDMKKEKINQILKKLAFRICGKSRSPDYYLGQLFVYKIAFWILVIIVLSYIFKGLI